MCGGDAAFLSSYFDYLLSLYKSWFGWNRCHRFDNLQVLIFCEFGLKMHIHVYCVFLVYETQNEEDKLRAFVFAYFINRVQS